jgi:hypothetical protein
MTPGFTAAFAAETNAMRGSSMGLSSKAAKDYYTKRLREFTAARYALYQEEKDPSEVHPWDSELGESATRLDPKKTKLPAEVQEAYGYYKQNVEEADWGSARVFRVPIQGKPTYAVRVRTDGDDGWLESYDESGKFLAAGRTYLDLVSWGPVDVLRGQVETKEMPADLDPDKSLWKPLS